MATAHPTSTDPPAGSCAGISSSVSHNVEAGSRFAVGIVRSMQDGQSPIGIFDYRRNACDQVRSAQKTSASDERDRCESRRGRFPAVGGNERREPLAVSDSKLFNSPSRADQDPGYYKSFAPRVLLSLGIGRLTISRKGSYPNVSYCEAAD